MTPTPYTPRQINLGARFAGLLYLVIIVLGVSSEMVLRAPFLTPDISPAILTEALPLFRLSLVADAVMVLADIGLAVLLYMLLRHVRPGLALAAMILRLMQAAVIAASLLFLLAAQTLADGAPHLLAGLIEVHGQGYDLGLIFFGVNTLLMAVLLCHSGYAPRWLPPLLALAGLVYLAGSFSRLLAPDLNAMMQPAYAIPLIAESAFCLLLLIRGLRPYDRAVALPA